MCKVMVRNNSALSFLFFLKVMMMITDNGLMKLEWCFVRQHQKLMCSECEGFYDEPSDTIVLMLPKMWESCQWTGQDIVSVLSTVIEHEIMHKLIKENWKRAGKGEELMKYVEQFITEEMLVYEMQGLPKAEITHLMKTHYVPYLIESIENQIKEKGDTQ